MKINRKVQWNWRAAYKLQMESYSESPKEQMENICRRKSELILDLIVRKPS